MKNALRRVKTPYYGHKKRATAPSFKLNLPAVAYSATAPSFKLNLPPVAYSLFRGAAGIK